MAAAVVAAGVLGLLSTVDKKIAFSKRVEDRCRKFDEHMYLDEDFSLSAKRDQCICYTNDNDQTTVNYY